MIKNIFALIGAVTVMVSLMGTNGDDPLVKKDPVVKSVKVSKRVKDKVNRVKISEITETKIAMTEEYAKLIR